MDHRPRLRVLPAVQLPGGAGEPDHAGGVEEGVVGYVADWDCGAKSMNC